VANIKLSDAQVQEIRVKASKGVARRELAIYYGVALETVSRIIRGDARVFPTPAPPKVFHPTTVVLRSEEEEKFS